MTIATKEFTGIIPMQTSSIISKDESITVTVYKRKDDVTVGAWTSHLAEAMAELQAGQTVHFNHQPIKLVRKQFRKAGYSLVFTSANKWEVTKDGVTYTLNNRTATHSIKHGNKTYERSVRRNK
ncbi:MAG: hypothetical protein KAJ19_11040 [Gammaproteobacteria bacterium]|nr:hypothetical protein [Gammaproteobacteria bacterium]